MTRDEYVRTLDALDAALSHLREGSLDSDEREGNALGGLLRPLGEIRETIEAYQYRYGHS